MTSNEILESFLRSEIALGTFPGAVYAIADHAQILVQGAVGHAVTVPARIAMTTETIFDLASLTKPLVTTALALRLVADGRVELDEPVATHVEELRSTDKARLTFRQLLTHSSGLQAWYPMYARASNAAGYLDVVAGLPLEYESGTRVIYSDPGFALLLLAIERITGRNGMELARELIFEPLALRDALFNPPPAMKPVIAATEWGQRFEAKLAADRNVAFDGFRRNLMWGELNDGNSFGMGGYAGTAGLFAPLADVVRIAQAWLNDDDALLPKTLIEEATRNHTAGLDENRGLGWQIRTESPSSISAPLSDGSFGHTGFTGTSVWIDRTRGRIFVLLTNRIHPIAFTAGMQGARREFHRLAVEYSSSLFQDR